MLSLSGYDPSGMDYDAEIEKCAKDRVYFVSNYLQIYEPRNQFDKGYKPFVLWPRQIEFFEALDQAYEKGYSLVVEKCRDMGATWAMLAWVFHHWLFDKNFTFLLGANKKEGVAKSDSPNPLFSRLDIFLQSLKLNAPWLIPEGFDAGRHSTQMLLTNPDNGNTIEGESCTIGFGRLKRASGVMLDEYAFWDFGVEGSVRHVSPFQVYISTVNGKNQFYRAAKRHQGLGRLFVFNWWEAPHHTQEWFDREMAETDEEDFRREVLRIYDADAKSLIYPGIEQCPIGRYRYNPRWPLYCCWDFGFGDDTVVLFIQRDPRSGDLYMIDCIVKNNVDVDWFVPFIPKTKPLTRNPYVYTEYEYHRQDVHAQWTGDVLHFGDPTGKAQTGPYGDSYYNSLEPYGIDFETAGSERWGIMRTRQQMASACIKRLSFDERCVYAWDQFNNYRLPKSQVDPERRVTAPTKGIHQYSHAVSAFERFAIGEPTLMANVTLDQQQSIWGDDDPWAFKETA